METNNAVQRNAHNSLQMQRISVILEYRLAQRPSVYSIVMRI